MDKSRAVRKLNRLQRQLNKEGALASKDLAELGKSYAQFRAPYRTGRLFHHIMIGKPKATETEYRIIAHNPLEGAPKGYRNGGSTSTFNLVRWMHTSARAKGIIRSGSPVFMYDTKEWLLRVAKTKVTGRFKNIKLR